MARDLMPHTSHPWAVLTRLLVAGGIFLSALSVALPDTAAASPRAIALAIAIGLMGVGVYLGAPKPGD